MWTLFVVTILPYIDDAKVVRYGEYSNKYECVAKMVQLEKYELGKLEYALCERVGKPKPVNDNK